MTNSHCKYSLSVIIPTYNRIELLSHTLKSLALQKVDKSFFEVIIVDDGSSDDTLSLVKRFEKTLHIKYVYQEDRGYRPSSARNLGIKIASSKICLFIDSGIILGQNCIKDHIDFHESTSHNFAAIGYILGYDEKYKTVNKLDSLIDFENLDLSIENVCKTENFLDAREVRYNKYSDKIENLPAPWVYFWGGHVSVSRENLIAVDLFDENFDGRWGVEDNELGFRLHKNGVKIMLLRSAKSIHYPHELGDINRQADGRQNCIYFHEKFNSFETSLFLKHYMDPSFVDLNELLSKSATFLNGQ